MDHVGRRWTAVAVWVLVLGSACSGSQSSGPPAPSPRSGHLATLSDGKTKAYVISRIDVRGRQTIEVDILGPNGRLQWPAFSPTVFGGSPGQHIALRLVNRDAEEHNFTLESQGVDVDIDAGATVTVSVSFPHTGFALFYCKFHVGSFQWGELHVA